jgi:hypothetical protein
MSRVPLESSQRADSKYAKIHRSTHQEVAQKVFTTHSPTDRGTTLARPLRRTVAPRLSSLRSARVLATAMEEPMIEEPSVSDDAKVEHIIAVLKATPGCTGAGESPYNGPELNKMDVHVRVDGKMIRRSGSAEFDTKLKMALHVRGRVEGMVGKAVVALAEEQLVSGGGGSSSSTQPEPHVTEAEMAWLAAWMDQQSDPSAITHADAEAALMQHRAQGLLRHIESQVRAHLRSYTGLRFLSTCTHETCTCDMYMYMWAVHVQYWEVGCVYVPVSVSEY